MKDNTPLLRKSGCANQFSDLLRQLFSYLQHHVVWQYVSGTKHTMGPHDIQPVNVITRGKCKPLLGQEKKKSLIFLLLAGPARSKKNTKIISNPLPVAFIFPPSGFISPGKKQLKGCQLLCVEVLLLLSIEFQVGLIREDRFDEFLQNGTASSRST